MPLSPLQRNSLSAAIGALTFLCALAPAPSYAWGRGGHWIVATIAEGRLTPHTRAIVTRLLRVPVPPAEITSESNGDFVRASIWADEVRREPGFEQTAPWHYIDNPFGIVPSTPIPPGIVGRDNVLTALRQEIAVLRDPKASGTERAESLRFLIHFVGDIHQPLHCATRVSPFDPDGDRGGNDFPLGGEARSLHEYWDEGLGSFPTSVGEVPAAAKAIEHECPATDPGWKAGGVTNIEGWMRESVSVARTFVYEGVHRGKTPPEKYREAGIKVANKRVAWAGYRLAALLNALFASEK